MAEGQYACTVCGEAYLREDLAETCASKPAEESIIDTGKVFRFAEKRGYGLNSLGVVVSNRLEKETHRLLSKVLSVFLNTPLGISVTHDNHDYDNSTLRDDALPKVNDDDLKNFLLCIEEYKAAREHRSQAVLDALDSLNFTKFPFSA